MARAGGFQEGSDPGGHLVRGRTLRLVRDEHAEPEELLDRPFLGPGSVAALRGLVENNHLAHDATRSPMSATIASGVWFVESIPRANTAASCTSRRETLGS